MISYDSLRVEFDGGFELSGTPDGAGDLFLVADIEGWGGANVDVQTTDRAGPGKRIDGVRYTGRELLLKGTAWSTNNVDWDVFRVRDKLERIAIAGTTMTVHEPTPGTPRIATVVRNGDLSFDTPKHNIQPFEIPLLMADPRKYSLAEHTVAVNPGPTIVTNVGTAPSEGYATLQASATNPWIEIAPYSYDASNTINPGQRLTLLGSMPAGTVIDFKRKRTWHPSDGWRELAARPRKWWGVQGTCSLVSSGSWQFTYRDAWF